MSTSVFFVVIALVFLSYLIFYWIVRWILRINRGLRDQAEQTKLLERIANKLEADKK